MPSKPTAVLGNIRGKGPSYRGFVWVTLCGKHPWADLRCHICACGCWVCKACGEAGCRCPDELEDLAK